MFGNLDPEKLLVLLVIALLILGPSRLPSTARRMGELWREISEVRAQMNRELQRTLPYRNVARRGAPGALSSIWTGLADGNQQVKTPSPVRPLQARSGEGGPEADALDPDSRESA
jgi:Sec-independent protein translocase protein TatA